MKHATIWNKPDILPPVGKDDIETYWVAIRMTRHPHCGDTVDTVVFPAQYMNMTLSLDGDGYPTNDDYLKNIDGDPVEAIGWHTVRDHEEFENYYPPLEFSDDYVLLGWAEYEVPEFKGLACDPPQPRASEIILDDQVKWIFGQPNFTCSGIAQALRNLGKQIDKKSEDEQAAVIHWMLNLYLTHGENWRDVAKDIVKNSKG